MANVTLNTILLLRNDTEANWESTNPTPKKGEACVSLDKGKIKIGDGSTAWTDLKYINATPEELSEAGVQNVIITGTGNIIASANFSDGILTLTKGSFTLSTDNTASNAPNGSITLKGPNSETESTAVVKGLRTAAFTESTAYDPAGAGTSAAKAIQGNTTKTVKEVEDIATEAQTAASEAQSAASSAQSTADTHIANKQNPHSVTATQVGLGNVLNVAQIPATEKGTVNGVATLGSDGKIPASQLPASVDEIVEAENKAALPQTGEASKIYITLDDNKTYRWGGNSSKYVEISASIALGETTGTAYEGNKGKATTDAFNTHNADNVRHITGEERTTWNGKTTMSEVETKGYQTAAQVKAIKVDNAANADQLGGTAAKLYALKSELPTASSLGAITSATGQNGITASVAGTGLTVGLNLNDIFILNGGNASGY